VGAPTLTQRLSRAPPPLPDYACARQCFPYPRNCSENPVLYRVLLDIGEQAEQAAKRVQVEGTELREGRVTRVDAPGVAAESPPDDASHLDVAPVLASTAGDGGADARDSGAGAES
jgi:hypothetical protein